MRSLIFGPMPAGARPHSHIAAGPWCFAGREADFPGWDGAGPSAFALPPDPFADADALDEAARAANASARALLLADAANRGADMDDPRALAAWTLLLGPYYLLAAHVFIERQKRLADLIALYGSEELLVPLPPASAQPLFADMQDFMLRGVLNPAFNHYLYARLLTDMAPAVWRITTDTIDFSGALRSPCSPDVPGCPGSPDAPGCPGSPDAPGCPGSPDAPGSTGPPGAPGSAGSPGSPGAPFAPRPAARAASLRARLHGFAAGLLRDLPFPRYKGFSLPQALALSLAVLSNKRQKADASLDFSLYCGKEEAWLFDAPALMRDCLPLSLRPGTPPRQARPGNNQGQKVGGRKRPDIEQERKGKNLGRSGTECSRYGKLSGPSADRQEGAGIEQDRIALALAPSGARKRPGPLRGMTPAFMQDDAYRLRLASLLTRGCRLFSVQHGANYGNLRSVGMLPFEYSRHAFFTWGWGEHAHVPANARPLPHPLLLRMADKHREQEATLILVGTEMSSLSYRLKSRPQAGGLPAYRRAKLTFLESVRQGLEQKEPEARLLYRPYPTAAGGLEDGGYVRRHLPNIPLCTGDLNKALLGCRLLVLDHYGTTLHTALAAGVPLIAYWDRRAWAMEEHSEKTLDILRAAGILCDSAEDAAARVLEVWPDVQAWWQAPERRRARAAWLHNYARINGPDGRPLSMAKLMALWWRAIRNC